MNAIHRPFIQNLKDIRIWIMLFFIVRLVGITNPPLETGHNWRQSLTSMITRNLSETGFDPLHPRIDMAGNESGFIGSEFPLFNAATYLCNETLGYSHWYGRLINLIVSSLGLWFFYKLIKRIFDSDTAFYSTLILAASIWFAFSRKTMPDTFSISLALGGLYYCSRFIDGKGQHNIFLYALFMSAGILCKLPAMLWMTPVGIYILTGKMSLKNKIPVVIASAFILAAAFSWYFVWVPHLVSTYHYQLYFPKSFSEGISEIADHIPGLLKNFYFHAFSSYVAFGLLLAGIPVFMKRAGTSIKITAAAMIAVFALFIIKTGSVFPLHNYYIIPFVPSMAVAAGLFLSRLPGKWQLLLVGVVITESTLNQQHDFFIKESERYKAGLELVADTHTNRKDLIIINGGQNPQLMYLAHRKGWTVANDVISDSASVTQMQEKGARFVIIDRKNDIASVPFFREIHVDEHFRIFKIEKQGG